MAPLVSRRRNPRSRHFDGETGVALGGSVFWPQGGIRRQLHHAHDRVTQVVRVNVGHEAVRTERVRDSEPPRLDRAEVAGVGRHDVDRPLLVG